MDNGIAVKEVRGFSGQDADRHRDRFRPSAADGELSRTGSTHHAVHGLRISPQPFLPPLALRSLASQALYRAAQTSDTTNTSLGLFLVGMLSAIT